MLDREWVTIVDPNDDHRRWTFDVSFLLSRWRCIYGQGCQGIRSDGPDPVVGCCVHGAYLVDAAERRHLERVVRRLTPELCDRYPDIRRDGWWERDDEGEVRTRTVDGACVFLNRSPGRMGCALHLLAEAEGRSPMETKPTVCWQLPLHRTISEEVGPDGRTVEVHTIAAFERGTWGEGGADFHWWCTEDPAAFTARQPLYRTMEAELRAMVGDEVYEELVSYLERRRRQRGRVRFLPLASGG